MTDRAKLQSVIEAAFERRAELTPRNLPADVGAAIDESIEMLDSGRARVAVSVIGRIPGMDAFQRGNQTSRSVQCSKSQCGDAGGLSLHACPAIILCSRQGKDTWTGHASLPGIPDAASFRPEKRKGRFLE